jgi:hypothetical protein
MYTWIYRPKSGDRVFALKEHPHVKVARYDNGCRHVLGGVHISEFTAEPGRHYRNSARKMLGEWVNLRGGVAWDERGTYGSCCVCGTSLFRQSPQSQTLQ